MPIPNPPSIAPSMSTTRKASMPRTGFGSRQITRRCSHEQPAKEHGTRHVRSLHRTPSAAVPFDGRIRIRRLRPRSWAKKPPLQLDA
jgi:hypothetical protein